MQILNQKTKLPAKVIKGGLLNNVRQFSVWQLAVFMLTFGVIGYTIYHSFAATTTTTTTTTTWSTYASPFGDKNCDNKNLTSTTADDCVASCTGSNNCGGSCLIVSGGGTGNCRPMTMQTCSDATNQAQSTIENSQIDQGVDYTVWSTDSLCKYNNPDPKDTQSSAYRNSKTDTRIYAMGRGIITCVGANPSTKFMQTLTLSQHCPGGNVAIGHSNAAGTPPSGLGTWIVYKLTDSGTGFPARGLKIYVSEGCNISRNAISDVTTNPITTKHRRWKVGDHVTPNSVLCEISPGTIEMGWANEGRQTVSGGAHFRNEIEPAAYTCFWKKEPTYGYWSTAWGLSFNNFVLKYDGNRFAGTKGPNAYGACQSYPKPAKYKITW